MASNKWKIIGGSVLGLWIMGKACGDNIQADFSKQMKMDSIKVDARQQAKTDSLNRVVAKRDSINRIKAEKEEKERQAQAQKQYEEENKWAYVCASGNSVKFHNNSSCRGLNRCKSGLAKILKTEAKQSYEPCKYCGY